MTGITAGQLSEAIRAAVMDGISTLFLTKVGRVRYTLELAAAIAHPKPGDYNCTRNLIVYNRDPLAFIKVSTTTSDIRPWEGWPGRIVVDHAVHLHGSLALAIKYAQTRFPVIAERR